MQGKLVDFTLLLFGFKLFLDLDAKELWIFRNSFKNEGLDS